MDIETNIANYDLSISYGYHLHEAGMYEKSFSHNKKVGEYATKIGDLDQAERCYITAMDDAKKLNKNDDANDTLLEFTNNVLMFWGRYDEALAHYHNLSKYFSKTQNLKRKSQVLRYIGEIYARRRDSFAKALKNFDDSLKTSEGLHDRLEWARTKHEMGNVFRKLRKYDEALLHYEGSLLIKEDLEDKAGVAITLHEIGNVYRKKGNHYIALKQYKKSLKISKKLNDKRGIARTLHEMGNVYKDLGDNSIAVDNYTESLRLQTQIGNQIGIARSLHEMGNIICRLGQYTQALEYYKKSLSIKRPLKVRYDIAITVLELARTFTLLGKDISALPHAIEAHLLLENLKDSLDDRALGILELLRRNIGANEYTKRYKEIAPGLVKRHDLDNTSYHYR